MEKKDNKLNNKLMSGLDINGENIFNITQKIILNIYNKVWLFKTYLIYLHHDKNCKTICTIEY
jgi:hypothetical protein